MGELVEKYKLSALRTLDVGSYDVNGTYRSLFTDYTGTDIAAGKNVDVVCEEYELPFSGSEFEVVISGQTLEHTKAFWVWVKELARVLRPGGTLLLVAPWTYGIHRYPVDCWRILPDGMRYLLGEWLHMDVKESFVNANDCWGVAVKNEVSP